MAMAESLRSLTNAYSKIPFVKQISLILGLTLSVSLGISVVLWVQEPTYRPIYAHLDAKDTAKVLDELQKANIKYKFNEANGGVLVPVKDIYTAKMKIAAAGVTPENDNAITSIDSGIGVSQFMEGARYRNALESELGRTIAQFRGVNSARVHLAIPSKSSFVGGDEKTTASVLLNVGASGNIDSEQVASITQLVAASIVDLNPNNVAVSDQYGRLLSSDSNGALSVSKGQFTYQKQVQEYYEKRIQSMISPLIGRGRVQVRVAADMDFSQQEKTSEEYNPENQVVRSEQTSSQGGAAGGGGGAPGAGANAPGGGGGAAGGAGGNSSQVKNYELGRSITYTTKARGSLKALSVAVVVDNMAQYNKETKETDVVPVPPAKLTQITDLVKRAIGFDQQRGDEVSVINSSFAAPEKMPEPEVVPIYKNPMVLDIGKKVLAVILALLILLLLVRPILKSLISRNDEEPSSGGGFNADQLTPDMMRLQEEQINSLKSMAKEQPAQIANIIKKWVATE
jgi:flagellar M-ring protein FliF